MGYCLINHAAIAAKHWQEAHGLERVAIIDFDVHHGNGTQHLLEDDPTVFFASLHQWPLYPGTGAASERGVSAARFDPQRPAHPDAGRGARNPFGPA